ncbi:hypothetical protein BKA82DRAFT_4235208 [Pisolithus tinctorius]|nr:hypothetical protein BKA82DRAFT_4235208 [Pisolithus tinctorius]
MGPFTRRCLYGLNSSSCLVIGAVLLFGLCCSELPKNSMRGYVVSVIHTYLVSATVTESLPYSSAWMRPRLPDSLYGGDNGS